MKHGILFLIFTIALGSHAAQAAGHASCYSLRLVDQDNRKISPEPVCRALEKNLNHFCTQPPMACGLKVAKEFRGKFRLPEWKTVELGGSFDLLESIVRSPWIGLNVPGADQINWDDRRPVLEWARAKGRLTVSQSTVDLYNLGEKQLTYRIDYGDCQELNPQLSDPEQWNEAIRTPHIHVQQAPDIIANLRQLYPAQAQGSNDIFFYANKTYSFAMAGKENYPNSLLVQRYNVEKYPASGQMHLVEKDICMFDYYGKTEAEK